jgi:hypothetical protein
MALTFDADHPPPSGPVRHTAVLGIWPKEPCRERRQSTTECRRSWRVLSLRGSRAVISLPDQVAADRFARGRR